MVRDACSPRSKFRPRRMVRTPPPSFFSATGREGAFKDRDRSVRSGSAISDVVIPNAVREDSTKEFPLFGRWRHFGQRMFLLPVGVGTLAAAFLTTSASPLAAQLPSENGYYTPFDQNLPPGIAGQWAAQTGRGAAPSFQPVKIVLPSRGKVTVYSSAEVEPIQQDRPAAV